MNLRDQALDMNNIRQANGKSFALPMLDWWIVCISDREHFRQLEVESESLLSRDRALREVRLSPGIAGLHSWLSLSRSWGATSMHQRLMGTRANPCVSMVVYCKINFATVSREYGEDSTAHQECIFVQNPE
jgi:hypothetical protein